MLVRFPRVRSIILPRQGNGFSRIRRAWMKYSKTTYLILLKDTPTRTESPSTKTTAETSTQSTSKAHPQEQKSAKVSATNTKHFNN